MVYLRYLPSIGIHLPCEQFSKKRRKHVLDFLNSNSSLSEKVRFVNNILDETKEELEKYKSKLKISEAIVEFYLLNRELIDELTGKNISEGELINELTGKNISEGELIKKISEEKIHESESNTELMKKSKRQYLIAKLCDPIFRERIGEPEQWQQCMNEEYNFIQFLENEILIRGLKKKNEFKRKVEDFGYWVERDKIFSWTTIKQSLADIIIDGQKQNKIRYSLDIALIARIIEKHFYFHEKTLSFKDIHAMLVRSEKKFKDNKPLSKYSECTEIKEFIWTFFNKFV